MILAISRVSLGSMVAAALYFVRKMVKLISGHELDFLGFDEYNSSIEHTLKFRINQQTGINKQGGDFSEI